MRLLFGSRLYGKVDQVPEVLHVATHFAHLLFIPLAPLRSSVIFHADGASAPIPLSGKSVVITWTRAALVTTAALTLLAALVAAIRGHGRINAPLIAAAVAWAAYLFIRQFPPLNIASYDRACQLAKHGRLGAAGLAEIRRLYQATDETPLRADVPPAPAIYFVIGTDCHSGQDVCITVWAKDADHAGRIGFDRGVQVSQIELTAAAPATPG